MKTILNCISAISTAVQEETRLWSLWQQVKKEDSETSSKSDGLGLFYLEGTRGLEFLDKGEMINGMIYWLILDEKL